MRLQNMWDLESRLIHSHHDKTNDVYYLTIEKPTSFYTENASMGVYIKRDRQTNNVSGLIIHGYSKWFHISTNNGVPGYPYLTMLVGIIEEYTAFSQEYIRKCLLRR